MKICFTLQRYFGCLFMIGIASCSTLDSVASGQAFQANTDEALVKMGTLPDPLVSQDGQKISRPEQWPAQRQALVRMISEHQFGFAPTNPAKVSFKKVDSGSLNDGITRLEQWVVTLSTDAGAVDIDLAIFLPAKLDKAKGCFLGLNFQGNHTVAHAPTLPLPKGWVANDKKVGIENNRALESMRGNQERRWPTREINEQGYAVATAYYGDIDPDFDDGFKNGVHALFPSHVIDAEHPNRWGTIAAWAWGMSRLLDVLQQHPNLDPARVAAIGHSRLGKTALWAGATDSRFSIVISNNSGCGGAALERRNFGETVARINTSFPHWFNSNFKKYNNNESALPHDSHSLIACIAPRPVYIASATKDLWADPTGEYLSGWFATPVYELLGYRGLPSETPPPADTSVGDRIGYHNRTGEHDILIFDWQQYIHFANRHWK